jgi:hypothetical protein
MSLIYIYIHILRAENNLFENNPIHNFISNTYTYIGTETTKSVEAKQQPQKGTTQKTSKKPAKATAVVPVRSITSFFAAKPKKVTEEVVAVAEAAVAVTNNEEGSTN